ncbi:hypothetical protein GCM10010347_19770 [Streptomyces cirratus]|uniref:YokE-like PH domain-containing protein n=1 Tax=Streptomyces cirratus TaxID=68187 RepID=A0ABQ3EU51_9ACTN|nr:hypothetical protein [Streptomyces cirratus]GHB50305.1 hypothetical protein GCM10010347_19770 [Streptomyces cirratus]
MPLNAGRQRQTFEAVTPLLSEGERVELITCANVGSVSVRRQVATAVVVGLASAGTLMAAVRPRQMYIVLTDRRLLFFDASTSTGKPGRVLMDFSRAYASAGVPSKGMFGLTLVTELALAGQDRGLKLVFPTPCRSEGRQLAESLAART